MSTKNAYQYAISLLAKRDYSTQGLSAKLRQKFSSLDQLVIDQLKAQNCLNDDRFCQNYIRYLQTKLYGPFLIKKCLQEKKIDAPIIEKYLLFDEPIWLEQAKRLVKKKSHTHPKKKSTQAMYYFLYQKGYTEAQIKCAISPNNKE